MQSNTVSPSELALLIGIGVVLQRSLAMGLGLLAVTMITISLILIESYRRSGLRAERKRAQDKTVANLSDTIVNAQAVKTFARETDELKSHRTFDRRVLTLRLKDWTSVGVLGSVRMSILLALQIGFIDFVAHLIQNDPSVLAIGIFSFAYTLSLTNKLFEVGTMIRNVEEAFLSASTMTEIILQQTEISDAPNAKKLSAKRGAINITAASFAYQDNNVQEEVFSNLTLDIPPSQKIGLVGPSGGGKSTLTRLLLRFEDVTKGSIAIDSQDIRDVTQSSLRQAISYVPQEPLLFHRSILENIAYGKPGATLKEVREAARLAYADDFIEKLPNKYDTIVGERGVKLSGGQRQRVAIARAILKDAPILILDEATSALDSESEVYIQKALNELMKHRTTIVIAHRLSTIQKMDRIIVLDNGKISEDGSHSQLLGQKGTYAKLWAHQSGGFIEE
jgi:ATP-binding cassette subfamily B protein